MVEFNFDKTAWPNSKKNIAGNETMLSFKINHRVRQAQFAQSVSDMMRLSIFPEILHMDNVSDVIGLYPASGQEGHSDFVFSALKDMGVDGCHVCVAKAPIFTGRPKPVDGTIITLSDHKLAERVDGLGVVRVFDASMSDKQMERQFGLTARRVSPN